MRVIWRRTLIWLAVLLAFVVLPCELVLGSAWAAAALVIGLFLMLSWHLVHLGQLLDWQDSVLDKPLPRGRGIWEIAFAGLHRRVRIRQGQRQSLAQTLERFMRAFEALPDGVIAYNRHQRIEWINRRAELHFALSAQGDRGQALTNLIRHPDFVAYLERGEFDEPLVYRGGRVDGLVLLLQVIVYGEDHRLLVSRDITQIERLETMRRDFIANVSHELKTPLTVVAGFSEMLAENHADYAPQEIEHYLQLICEQNGRMQRLITDLLTLSALESGGALAGDERVDVEPLLRSLLSEAEALSNGRHTISLDIEQASVLAGNTNELRSAFGNLIGNAVRYTPEGGRIDIAWVEKPDECVFSVADTGIGIAPQHIPRLTERFYRVDRSRSRETGGTGLGLAIVKHVLTRHQATLQIDSDPGKGSRFAAHFPKTRLQNMDNRTRLRD